VSDAASLSFEWTCDNQHHFVEKFVFANPVLVELTRCLLQEFKSLNGDILWGFYENAK
jgi:hypothetical protein